MWNIRKKKLHPEHPDALDTPDFPDATCLTRMQIATAPYVRTQIATASAYRTEHGRAFSFWTHCVRAFSFWTLPCQGIFLLDPAVSGYFPSGPSRVRIFSFWTQLCQGIFLLDASGRRVSWHHVYTGCQDTEHCSKYSGCIRKHVAGFRYSDSVQFYSLYLRYVHLYMLLHTSRFQQKHPASLPSP